ncbi:helix-turn-helix domain-containing protein [Streptomyces millisiae]|uniref:Helix-turn-helix transcriptional regulator n=1 Tax=Streptomyces millisiae TaxID=3075542 RepID=A0ABU2LPX9_9ACTN|nr:helix-turn-helix transcriptional regulator [Streptomyces sp. DSM 44918]MDT0319630.1 helix-turn-helix transcriptional regulator [Streptomyces sp. DSM 44918]
MALDPERRGDPKRELAEALKELRLRVGLTGDRLARRCNISQSKISRIETGKVLPSVVDVERIVRALGAPADIVSELMALARMANTEWQGLRSLYRKGLHRKQNELADLEAGTSEFRYFLPSVVTGLLSTRPYMRATLRRAGSDVDRIVDMKIARQEILEDRTKAFTFLLTEQAVRWPLVPAAEMARQIDRLKMLSQWPNIRIGVLPLRGGIPVMALSTFTVYDRTLATVETTAGIVILRDSRDVAAYLGLFGELEERALFGAAAVQQLSEWAQDFE